MTDRKPCLDNFSEVKSWKKFDIIKSHAYAKPYMESQALPVTAAYEAEILG
jgi:hypothetical protein